MGQPLEDILAGKEPEAQAEETVVEQKEEAQAPEEEKPQEDAAPEEKADEATEDTSEPEGVSEPEKAEAEPPAAKESKEVPLAALLDERDKRKELQSELEQLKKAQEEAKQNQEDLPDFWENPQAHLEVIERKFEEKIQQKEQELNARLLQSSMVSAAYRHKDFDQYREAFAQAAEQNNALVDQALMSPDPGEYIYETGRQFAQFDEVGGDIDSLRAKIRAEIMQELAEKDESKKTKLAAVPTPITDETNASAPQEKVEGGPTPLDNIFSKNRM